jgi:hypothetical protein
MLLLEKVLAAGAFVFGVVLSLIAMHTVEQRFLPVMKDWSVAQIVFDGEDVVLSGTMRKVRACEYEAPPRARTSDGDQLEVVSANVAATKTWAPADVPQQYGPWRIKHGFGHRVEVYQVHRCHRLWLTFSMLGKIGP